MITLVKHVPTIRKVGEKFEVFKGRQPAEVGEAAEVVDSEGATLNIAQVTDIYTKDGNQFMTLKVVA